MFVRQLISSLAHLSSYYLNSSSASSSSFLYPTMAKKFVRLSSNRIHDIRKENLNVGTIGHVDHGKTTLTAAITRFLSQRGRTKFVAFDEIDKAKEEKRRGITINVAHVGYETNKRRYAHTDCPGHVDFIKNMITGTSQMDVAILVVAATDGVMKQTREHVLLSKQIGISRVIVFINKADVVDSDTLLLVEIEVRELLEDHGFSEEGIFVVKGSALRALDADETNCIEELLNVLDGIPLPKRVQESSLLMPIASRAIIKGRGTVAVGTIERGTLNRGDSIEIKGSRGSFLAKALDIEVFGKSVLKAEAGEHCGVLCKGVKIENVNRGMWLGSVNSVKISNFLRVDLFLLDEGDGGRRTAIRSGYTNKIYCTTWDQVARIHLENDLLMPGELCNAYVVLDKKVPVEVSRSFTLRDVSLQKTVARGIISEILPSIDTETRKGLKILSEAVRNIN